MIGIIGALREEIEYFEAKFYDIQRSVYFGMEFTSGEIHGKKVVVVLCGVGKVNAAMATATLICKYNVDYILSTGTAGGISENKLTTVIASATVQHDFFINLEGKRPGQLDEYDFVEIPCSKELVSLAEKAACKLKYDYSTGIIATGDCFVSDPALKQKIQHEFNAKACDMESSAIAQVCYKAQKPFLSIRTLSDAADDEGTFDYNLFKKEAATRNSHLISELLGYLI